MLSPSNWVQRAIGSAVDEMDIADGYFEFPPLIRVADGKQYLMLLFSNRDPLGASSKEVDPPHLAVEVDYPQMSGMKKRTVAPSEYGGADARPADLADVEQGDGDERIRVRRRYRELLSLVLEKEWLLDRNRDEKSELETGAELTRLMTTQVPAGLWSCFQNAGKDLFRWLLARRK